KPQAQLAILSDDDHGRVIAFHGAVETSHETPTHLRPHRPVMFDGCQNVGMVDRVAAVRGPDPKPKAVEPIRTRGQATLLYLGLVRPWRRRCQLGVIPVW